MTTISTADRSRPFEQNRLLQCLTSIYLFLWGLMAIAPLDRTDWLLENMLVFAFCGLAVSTFQRFQLSDLSYSLIFAFLMLHAMGAHYTYGQVPIGYWIRDHFGWRRNDFDRVAHFCYGLLFAYPIRELFQRRLRLRGIWPYVLAVDVILASSAFYELLEAWVGMFAQPKLAEQFMATQGDYFDTQNDMATALLGAVIAMSFNAWRNWRMRRLET
jgi:putative membrane protein